MTYTQIFHAFLLFLHTYLQTRSCNGQCTVCQNSSWFCLTQGKLYTQQEFWGLMLDVVWERADCVFWNGLHSPWQAIFLKSARFHKAEDISEAKHQKYLCFFSHTCWYNPDMPIIQQMLHLVFQVLSLWAGSAMAIGFTWRTDYTVTQNKNSLA